MRLEWTPPICSDCHGDGWTISHANECYEKGHCVGCGGVQVQCNSCRGTGRRA